MGSDKLLNKRTKIVLTVAVLVVVALGVYQFIPHPEIVDVETSKQYMNSVGTYQQDVFVTVKNNGVSGWVNVVANFYDENSEWSRSKPVYINAGETETVTFSFKTGKWYNGGFVWLPQFSTAHVDWFSLGI